MIFQNRPPFSLSGAYNAKTKMVEIRWKAGFLLPVALGLSPESFFQFCDKIVYMWAPFIEALKRILETGVEEDLKVDFDDDQWDKMMEDSDVKDTE